MYDGFCNKHRLIRLHKANCLNGQVIFHTQCVSDTFFRMRTFREILSIYVIYFLFVMMITVSEILYLDPNSLSVNT